MEEILVAILQALFEFILEVLSYGTFDWPSSSKDRPEPESIAGRCVLWFMGGCILAGLSVLAFNHTFIHWPPLRMANLVVAPVTSALLSQTIARHRAKNHPLIVPRNHFWQSFWFTLGLVIIRFTYAVR
ncbi:hypothetical protein [Vogesella sp. LIG4]|uniref:hypothetical protein n=1 Tax=Vogesella sp. LIG4 TaxID=1192162 RepID=UPI0012FD0AEE|nr:hypothetical protein [Vogesella sp. LIG4]